MELYVEHRESQTRVLGPGLRYALWLQGCKKRCTGCINPEGWSLTSGGTYIPVHMLLSEIKAVNGLRGITVSGGEPFLQAGALAQLVSSVKNETELDIMVFSGYTLHELQVQSQKSSAIVQILKNIDLLVDGEYRAEENHNQMYRGSGNQRIYDLSGKYMPYLRRMELGENRSFEFVCRGKEQDLFTVGIPPQGFQKVFWQQIKNRQMKEENI